MLSTSTRAAPPSHAPHRPPGGLLLPRRRPQGRWRYQARSAASWSWLLAIAAASATMWKGACGVRARSALRATTTCGAWLPCARQRVATTFGRATTFMAVVAICVTGRRRAHAGRRAAAAAAAACGRQGDGCVDADNDDALVKFLRVCRMGLRCAVPTFVRQRLDARPHGKLVWRDVSARIRAIAKRRNGSKKLGRRTRWTITDVGGARCRLALRPSPPAARSGAVPRAIRVA